jgi:rod shape-determining protein MreD
MNRLVFAVICLMIFLLQSAFLPFLSNGAWLPDLWLVTVVISLLAYDRYIALMFAVIGGVLADIGTGNFFGLHLFPYVLAMVVAVFYIREKYHRRIFTSFLFVAMASCLYIPAMWFVIWMAGGEIAFRDYVWYRGLPMMILNVLAVFFVHPLLWSVKKERVARW